jgi:hypothetical protein
MATILTAKQEFVLENYLANPQYKRIHLYGGSRSGKTFLVADYVFNRAVAYPGSSHLFVRSTLTALTTGLVSQTFPDLFRVYKEKTGTNFKEARTETGKPFIVHKAQPYNRFELYNGSEIRFIGLDVVSTDSSALDKVLSQEYLTICVEEAPEMDFEAVEMLLTRLAQKVNHFKTGKPGIPKLLATCNPRLFEDWDYIYFTKRQHPIDETPVRNPEMFAAIHFELKDNEMNVSDDYRETLEGMSASKQARFLRGEYSDDFEGEIFKKLYWEVLPPLSEFDGFVIYTDPSYKSGPKNDFKASVLIGRRRGAFWLVDARAMQTTTSQMVRNVHDLYKSLVERGWNGPCPIYFENAGMPDDFTDAIQSYAENNQWLCPYTLDNRDKGDKYARIESILEPLNTQQKFIFNIDLKSLRIGNLITVQFLQFRKNLPVTEHDDIPDACHGAVTILNAPIIKPGGTNLYKRNMNTLG